MIKPKNVAISAGVGFILSFLISIIATHQFLSSLLRGCIFGVIFALFTVGITYVYKRFLEDSAAGDTIQTPDVETKKTEKVGTVVDFSIDDSGLTDDGQGPQFYVGNNKRKLSTEDTASAEVKKNDNTVAPAATDKSVSSPDVRKENVVQEPQDDAGDVISNIESKEFQRVDLGIPFSAKDEAPDAEKKSRRNEPVGEQESKKNKAPAVTDEEIDELPDIGSIDSGSSSQEESDDTINDSDFAVAGKQRSSSKAEFSDGSNAANHDSETMAKAIRTLLKKDE